MFLLIVGNYYYQDNFIEIYPDVPCPIVCGNFSEKYFTTTLSPNAGASTSVQALRIGYNQIQVKLPVDVLLRLDFYGEGSDDFTMYFYASWNIDMNMRKDDNCILVSLSTPKNRGSIYSENTKNSIKNINEWTLEVYDSNTAKITASQKCTGINTSIDCTGWKPGLYIVKAKIGKQVLSEKIHIK